MGSGAPEIGRLVAERLGAEYVDREIMADVADRLQRESREVAAKEMPPGTLVGRVMDSITRCMERGAGYRSIYLPTWQMPLEDASYIHALSSVILDLAEEPPVVIRGRGSQFILKGHPGTLHALVVAPLEVRVRRVGLCMGTEKGQRRRSSASMVAGGSSSGTTSMPTWRTPSTISLC
jgi:hypothetical protein